MIILYQAPQSGIIPRKIRLGKSYFSGTMHLVYVPASAILGAMKIYAIDHVQLAMPAREEDRARAFYTGVLGLAETPKLAELATRGGVWFEDGAVKIHLGVELDFRPARKAHPALLVDDLSALIQRCQQAGYTVDTSQPPLAGYQRAHVFDPFGNRIELMERAEPGVEPGRVDFFIS
jgi:catechol 2,3-dioxygenase-like lactoylglutathione lyase family enzyme